MKNYIKLFAFPLVAFICLSTAFIFLEDNQPQKENTHKTTTQIFNEEVVFNQSIHYTDIEPNTIIDEESIITLPIFIYSEDRPSLKASLFFTTKHSNIDSTYSFDYDKFKKFIEFYRTLNHDNLIYAIHSSDTDITVLATGYFNNKFNVISFFNKEDALISFDEYIEFKSIIAENLTGYFIQQYSALFDKKIEVIIAERFNFILPDSKFNLENAEQVINFFEVIENNKPFSIISYFEDAKEEFVNHYGYDINALFHNYKSHYNNIVNLDKEESIENFKLNNYIKVPKNDNVCFVKIPDNVVHDFSTIGEINFTFKGYRLDAYNCNE